MAAAVQVGAEVGPRLVHPHGVDRIAFRGRQPAASLQLVGDLPVAEAEDLEGLRGQVRDAVHCHFEEGQGPRVIRLHFVHEEVIAA